MFHFDFALADTANQMVMVSPSDLVAEMSVTLMGGMYQSILCEKFERTIDRWLGDAWEFHPCQLVDLTGRKVSPCMTEDMQDRHPLGRHSESTRTELGSVIG